MKTNTIKHKKEEIYFTPQILKRSKKILWATLDK